MGKQTPGPSLLCVSVSENVCLSLWGAGDGRLSGELFLHGGAA